jgi:hypothetical protein
MTCLAMPRTRQPAMPAPGRPGRVRRDAASGTVPAQPQAECLVRRDARHRYQNGRRVACLL